jgi:hypothetical protein
MDSKSGDSDILSLTLNFFKSFSKIYSILKISVNFNLEFFLNVLKINYKLIHFREISKNRLLNLFIVLLVLL